MKDDVLFYNIGDISGVDIGVILGYWNDFIFYLIIFYCNYGGLYYYYYNTRVVLIISNFFPHNFIEFIFLCLI